VQDFYHRWYYQAYAPSDYPAGAAPPMEDTPRTASYLVEYLRSTFKSWMSPANEQEIYPQITHHESCLDAMLCSLDDHDLCAREIDSTNVAAWEAKYHAWVIRQRALIQIEKVIL
jgi:hypothetical protein